MSKDHGTRIGWIGTGRMGAALVRRLLEAGHDVAVFNRTRSKAEALAELGAVVVDSPADLADRDIVFTMVGGSDDFKEVVIGPNGVLSRADAAPRMLIDSTTISQAASDEVRAAAAERGTAVLATPVSGNAKVVAAGRLTMVVSGPESAYTRGARAARAARRPRHLRRRRRPRAAREDLPQPDARRRRADARRDHGAGGEGRRLARGLLRLPQRQRDGLDVHPLQDARLRQSRLQADLHAGAAAEGLQPRRRRGARARGADAGLGRSAAGGPVR